MTESLNGIDNQPVLHRGGSAASGGEFKRLLQDQREKTEPKLPPDPKAAQKLKKACVEYEAFFITQMMGKLRASVVPEGEGLFNSQDEEYLLGLLETEQGKALAAKGSMGIANLLYRQMEKLLPRALPEETEPAAVDQSKTVKLKDSQPEAASSLKTENLPIAPPEPGFADQQTGITG